MLSGRPARDQWSLEAVLPDEHARLVRLCAYLSGDQGAAEDLAQETMIEAWRQQHKLVAPEGYRAWLTAIARNVCLRWQRRHSREHSHLKRSDQAEGRGSAAIEHEPTDDFDLEVELERSELAELLDRALALLPADTRTILIQKYVEDSPPAEIAARLGLSEGAVAMRLQRGKLAFKRVLTNELRADAAVYGLVELDADDWQETNIWCIACSKRKLVGRFTAEGELQLDCVGCDYIERWGLSRSQVTHGGSFELFKGIKGFKPALNRLAVRDYGFLKDGSRERTVRCSKCGADAPLYTDWEEETIGGYYVEAYCAHCGEVIFHTSLVGFAGCTPAGRRFLRAHPRIRALPTRDVEAAGVPAVVTTYESVTSSARFEAVFVRDTFELIGVHLPPGA